MLGIQIGTRLTVLESTVSMQHLLYAGPFRWLSITVWCEVLPVTVGLCDQSVSVLLHQVNLPLVLLHHST